MTKQHYFVQDDQNFFLTSDKPQNKHEILPGGNYLVQYDMMTGFYLQKFDDFKLPKKIYGNHHSDADRILNTFAKRPTNTGVLLSGEKGSGKTLLTKEISVKASKAGIPTLIINNPYRGDQFSSFVSNITQPAILLFDEFEKVYEPDQQRSILTLMDGVFENNKLFLLTCNEKGKIDTHMSNRPGRLFYAMEYEGLDSSFIAEYCEDNLINKVHLDSVCALADMFWRFNFDMLQAVVEEMNRYNESAQEALRMLNVKPDFKNISTFKVSILDADGNKVPDYQLSSGENSPYRHRGNPMAGFALWRDLRYNEKGVYRELSDEEETSGKFDISYAFSPETILKVDGRRGLYIFKNEKGEQATLTKEVPETFNYMKYL